MKPLLSLLAVVAFASSLHAQAPSAPQVPPLSTESLASLNLYRLPSSQFSAGWDSIKSVAVAENFLIRVFYRKSDGLLLALKEDRNGIVNGGSRVWYIGSGMENIDVTPMTYTQPSWTVELVIFGYDRFTGVATRRALYWDSVNAF